MIQFETRQTKLQNFDVALSARKERESLKSNGSVVAPTKSFKGRIHFLAKGDIELQLNGKNLSFRNESDNDEYVCSETRPEEFKAGDVILIKVRATASFRGAILAIESDDNSVAVPIALTDYKTLKSAFNKNNLNASEVQQIQENPRPGPVDRIMRSMWEERKISAPSRNGSEWMRIDDADGWHYYAVAIRPEMIVPVE